MEGVTTFFSRALKAPARQNDGTYKIRYSTLFWLFLFGSIAGFILEGIWCIFTKGHWEHHAATVWGPFCIIYGIGAVAVYLLSAFMKGRSLWLRFIVFTASGAAVEYFGSLFQEFCFGSVSWDYSGHVLNLGGRVSLKMALLWGVLGILFMRFVFPPMNRFFEKIKGKGWRIACVGMTVFMAANLFVTAAAVIRWGARTAGKEGDTSVVQWLDDAYDDQTMTKLFPNMQFRTE